MTVFVCVCVCVCVCMYIYIYIYIYELTDIFMRLGVKKNMLLQTIYSLYIFLFQYLLRKYACKILKRERLSSLELSI